MPTLRELPAELAAALQLVRAVELAAGNTAQYNRAVQATAVLLLAASDAGWSTLELASGVGIDRKAVQARFGRARRVSAATPAGLNVPAPPPRQPVPLRKQSVESRDWLYTGEARRLAGGINRETLAQWRRGGRLPATRRPSRNVYLYLRCDLERVMAAPSYKNHGVDRATVRAWIAEASVPGSS